MSSPVEPPPVVIVGAARSGTNMLRDLLVRLPGFVTWPCDEINYVWRHGNREFPTDEFTRAMADEKTKSYILRQFAKFPRKSSETIVEKTCATTFRCGFVHEVLPNARFINIIRDGRDVAASASLRWNAKLDLPYILKKARYVPLSDVPYYGFNYFKARLYRIFAGKKRLSTWGPRFEGMDEVFVNHPLAVGCAIQWKASVASALEQLKDIPPSQVLTVRYEELTQNPVEGLSNICQFLGAVADEALLQSIAKNVSSKSVGKWKGQLSEDDLAEIEAHAGPLLRQLGYQ